jgi:hypothetical protein
MACRGRIEFSVACASARTGRLWPCSAKKRKAESGLVRGDQRKSQRNEKAKGKNKGLQAETCNP